MHLWNGKDFSSGSFASLAGHVPGSPDEKSASGGCLCNRSTRSAKISGQQPPQLQECPRIHQPLVIQRKRMLSLVFCSLFGGVWILNSFFISLFADLTVWKLHPETFSCKLYASLFGACRETGRCTFSVDLCLISTDFLRYRYTPICQNDNLPDIFKD